MLRYCVCLANSYKFGGRCLAGVELLLSSDKKSYKISHRDDGNPQWLRPVQQGADHETINIQTAQNIKLLDVLELDVTDSCGQGSQSENVYFKKLKIINHLRQDTEILELLCSNENVVLSSNRTFLTANEYQKGTHSLMFIKPENPKIFAKIKETEEGKKQKYYAQFHFSGNEYCLPITAPQYLELMKTYSPFPLLGDFPTGTFYFTISMAAEEWKGVHHKLLAGVIDMRLVNTSSSDNSANFQEADNTPYHLAEEYALRTNKCLFITGKAGTGKTTFLRHLQQTTKKNIAIVAPTGVAAINAGGMTIHSFFQLPIRTLLPTPQSYSQMYAEQRMVQRKRNMLSHLEMLVIDEISMVRADVLDAIDAVLRHYHYRRDIPFGGVQVVMIGDLMQLSPVLKGDDNVAFSRYYDGPYFFHSKVMQQLKPVYIELDHVFRQQNEQFVALLNEVRDNRLTEMSRQLLASRYIPTFKNTDNEPFHITLTTHNHQADSLNRLKLDELTTDTFSFQAQVIGNFPESNYPTEETLQLKLGARVMFIRNDDHTPRQFFNGKLGIITNLTENSITVLSEGEEIEVEPMVWKNIRYKEDETNGTITEDVLGTFTQFPLRLAWAITIHKSQGLTFDYVIIDAASAFAAEQVYVALSRCRTLEGIVLSSSLQHINLQGDVQVNKYIELQPTTEQVSRELNAATNEYQLQLFTDLFSLSRPLTLVEQLQKYVAKCVSFNPETDRFLNEIRNLIVQQLNVVERFQTQLRNIILSPNVPNNDYLQQRLQSASDYFLPRLKEIADMVSNHPCKCKNKADVNDFDTILSDLFLVINQKIHLMPAIAKDSTSEAFLSAKSRFVAPLMLYPSAFEKPETKKSEQKKTKKNEKPAKEPKIQTAQISYELYLAGNGIEQIAKQRKLTEDTILSHLSKYITEGQLSLTDLVPSDVIDLILRTQAEHPEFTTLKEFYTLLNEEVSYGYLRLVLAAHQIL